MRKLFTLFLVLLVAMQGIALAEAVGEEGSLPEATEAPGAFKLALRVVDGEGEPFVGAQVTVRDALGAVVYEYTVDETGVAVIDTLAAGVYSAKAIDPADGYSTAQSFNFLGDTGVDLVIRKLVEGSKLVVGSVTTVSGNFFTDMWGNNTSDIDVRAMLHGYSTVAWTNEAVYAVDDSVVTVTGAAVDADGNKTYTFAVNPELTYNDGTPINARDYVFSVLLQSAPETAANGAMTYAYSQLLGCAAFNTGETEVFSGVRLIDDHTFSLTIAADYLPYFYELIYVNVTPYPIGAIAPGCTVADDGEGAYITALNGEDGNPLGEFTAEVLKQTILDPETGYLSNPSVTSGPYALVEYNREEATVSFAANRAYRGDYQGQRPLIDQVTLVPVKNAELLGKLEAGEVDIVNKVSDGSVIAGGMAGFAEGLLRVTNYLRSGLGFIGFACEEGPTASANVRKAISHCLDKEALTTAFTDTYGLPVYSYYGLGQWMTTDYINEMDQHVTVYPLDLDAAAALLDQDGWTLNEQGGKFVPGTDLVRYKELEGEELADYQQIANPIVSAVDVGGKTLLPLSLRFAKLKDSAMTELLDQMISENLRAVGFQLEIVDTEFAEMLSHYNRQTNRTYNMFALATNFKHVFDPYYAFNGAEQYQGELNQSGIDDEELLELAKALRETTPGDNEGYIERWLSLMQRYSDLLPTVPIYSNVYFDFIGNHVQNYAPNAHWSWPAALLYTYSGEPLVLEDLLQWIAAEEVPAEGEAPPEAAPTEGN